MYAHVDAFMCCREKDPTFLLLDLKILTSARLQAIKGFHVDHWSLCPLAANTTSVRAETCVINLA